MTREPLSVANGSLVDVFSAYAAAGDATKLTVELERSGNGAAAKRIGYLAEHLWPDSRQLIDAALAMRTTGIIKLDPAVRRRGRINSKWRIEQNVNIESVDRSAAPRDVK